MSVPRKLPKSMEAEWMRCPRCTDKKIKPQLISTDRSGTKMWWVCENYDNCFFPLDMPSNIYTIVQSPFQKQQNIVPLPAILSIPEKYRYLYPITFADSRPLSRCTSTAPTKANSKNETIDSSESGSFSEKSSGKKRLKADVLGVESEVVGSVNSSSSGPSEGAGEDDNIDEELEHASRKRSVTCRTLTRKRFHDSSKSWKSLIEKVASDKHASDAIINMQETELFDRMKEFFDDKYSRGSYTTFTRSRRFDKDVNNIFNNKSYRAITYRVDDVENCLRTITQDDWDKARKRLPQISIFNRAAVCAASGESLLKRLGIDLNERRKAVGEKVEKVMREFSTANVAKRQKLEVKRDVDKEQKTATLKNDIHLSVSSRILNRKRRREDEDRSSAASTPSFYSYSEPATPHPSTSNFVQPEERIEAAPVQFHIGNEEEQHDDTWGFDLDGLYESIHDRNRVKEEQNPLDPVEALLFPVDDNPVHDLPPADDLGVESGDEQPQDEDEDPFAGYDDFSGLGNSNSDFVNDNFGF